MKVYEKGLQTAEAQKRLTETGFNELKEGHKLTVIDLLLRQVKNFIVYILVAAALISLAIGEWVNFVAISAIIGVIIVLGFVQEYRAEKAIAALKKSILPKSRVYRDGKLVELPAREIAPGDLILLETGDKVPADAEIVEVTGLRVDESMLTGESEPVEKKQGSLLYAGTNLVYGRCTAIVKQTGMSTKLGQIAGLIQVEETETPLQKRVTQLSKHLALLALAACALTLIVGLVKAAPFAEMLIIALALAVAAVPEGLALTLTLTLAYGAKHMAGHKAIIRKMLAVETLGSVTVICTDKTGTLTKNEMTVEKIYTNNAIYQVTGSGYAPFGNIEVKGKIAESDAGINLLSRAAVLCNNASLSEVENQWKAIGDPTEAALLAMGAKTGLWKDDVENEFPRVEEKVFTSERKMMTTLHKKNGELMSFTKGAPEAILSRCKYVYSNGKKVELDGKKLKKITQVNSQFSAQAYRTLALAYRDVSSEKQSETSLTFLGIVAMRDPPRIEVPAAIATCKEAGIKVIMITGDNQETAIAIAKNIGIMDELQVENKFKEVKDKKLHYICKDGAITGTELETLSDEELSSVVNEINVYARVMPEQKLRIVNALKRNGHVIAMTGDGVNDAPALKKADIGVAMGLKGTDVAREASSMALQDDNFATIVEAIKQGRTIYDNIEKFTTYLISRNFTEVILILLGTWLLGFELVPLIALQILFINTFDEIIPALSLGLDPSRQEVMKRRPRAPNEPILNKRNLTIILFTAAFIGLMAFTIFNLSEPQVDLVKARTLTFAAIISTILFIPYAFRSLEQSLFSINPFSNKLMVLGTVSTFAITVLAMYTPFFQQVFKFAPLTVNEWFLPIAGGLASMLFIELVKRLAPRNQPNPYKTVGG